MKNYQTDNLILAALERQADAAPQPGPVAEGLPALRSRRRRRRVLTGLAVVAVVGALAVPTYLATLSNNSAPLPPAESTEESTEDATPQPPGLTMQYTADWLPEGYSEVSRWSTLTEETGQERSWVPLDKLGDRQPYYLTEHRIALSVHEPTTSAWDIADAVTYDRTINGFPTLPAATPHGAFRVSWMPDENTVLMVRVEAIPDTDIEELAYRVAESVRPDGEAQLRPAMEANWIPPTMEPSSTRVFRTSGGWGAGYAVQGPSQDSEAAGITFTAEVVPAPPRSTDHGESVPVQINGREGRFWATHGSAPARLQTQLSDGRWLTVRSSHADSDLGSEENVTGFAAGLLVHPELGEGWFGE